MATLTVEVEVPGAASLEVTGEALSANLFDGRTITVPLEWYPRLTHATPAERENYELYGDGQYIRWPDLDEDLTIKGLIAGKRSGESPRSFQRWLAARQTGQPVTIHDITPPQTD